MQGKFAVFVHHGVARVVAALIAADDVVFLGDQVDHAALALVAPVDAHDCTVAHIQNSLFCKLQNDRPRERFSPERPNVL
jgi:hypothetical protein